MDRGVEGKWDKFVCDGLNIYRQDALFTCFVIYSLSDERIYRQSVGQSVGRFVAQLKALGISQASSKVARFSSNKSYCVLEVVG